MSKKEVNPPQLTTGKYVTFVNSKTGQHFSGYTKNGEPHYTDVTPRIFPYDARLIQGVVRRFPHLVSGHRLEILEVRVTLKRVQIAIELFEQEQSLEEAGGES